jgi:catechol 2,3-dioxygenase-like lactoylglutathione lyase family enzyme
MNLNHLHINVPDVSIARAFYERYFGFRFKLDHGDGVFLENNYGVLLAIDPFKKDEKPFEFPSWFHFGFCLSDPQTVKDLYHRMDSDGVEFFRELKEFGSDAVNFFCKAPGGYKIEVSWNVED